ncbi:Wzz/FepE/Etk N-terminal domain-containing protein [Pseudomonas guariconensis]|uniref:Wzz/FepE/Etk N-terminal domain-containing protein n=1 Tax=Pseudomonas TaxID=286 RepID=UPI0020985FA7|nr:MULTISPECIES: Wzz/FepE/Etk N-terminal domain-containing protein [Pseudomonas]MCO7638967.1 Wzz/FepE/Etk N-terminal domain-containing protein [Pseudomonas sp. S 311-6]MCO7516734.1 Wzz/FepE/Etk N-terminal domain-containing protein [Pseudomonas putida]MCO7565670.1 Wzz/FepE/Etk N-terminal domain-containing protein [Pseudomonas mosselii]MCO7607039.1 Wzz/FepE/Etk N-terminal domain-containing protein [Pseudomonas guariconensis]MCO7617805.1 Wzz/FepE/Etk N-terminal domain-containing protein [Pseudomo
MRDNREHPRSGAEISLFELVQGAWRQKVWMIAAAMPVLLVGVVYVVLAKPVYEAKLYVQPPNQTDIAQLNYGRGSETGLGVWSVKDVYEVYLRALQSEAVRNKFFRTVYLPSLPESERSGSWDLLYREYAKALSVAVAAKDSPSRYVITVNVEDPQRAANWVVRYAEMAAGVAKPEVLKINQSEMQIKADNIEQQIAGDRASARKEREDKIAKLKEALVVAKAIGLKKPPLISGALSTEVSAVMEGSLSYMRGSDALEKEITNLESRVSDDPFIENLRKKQQALALYRNLKVDAEVISVYRQDGAVEQPVTPIRPKKVLMLVLTALFATVFGVFAGVARSQWLRMREG